MSAEHVTVKVWTVLPYRSRATADIKPEGERVDSNRQSIWLLKNGQGGTIGRGRFTFDEVVSQYIGRVSTCSLFEDPEELTLVPVPRSGASQPAFAADADPYPCKTIAERLAAFLSSSAEVVLTRTAPCTEKHNVQANLQTLSCALALPTTRRIVLIDDVVTTGATTVACAIALRRAGYEGEISALCAGRTVDTANKFEAQPKLAIIELSWRTLQQRPSCSYVGQW